MESVGILDVYDNIIQSNGDYCKICFRTSRERKLVTPVFFQQFLSVMNILNNEYSFELKVCYICERLAMSVMRFHRAVMFGVDLEELFAWIKSQGIRHQVMKHFNGVKVPPNPNVYKRAKSCEKKYQQLQDSVPYSLQCTNTLLVNIDAVNTNTRIGTLRKAQSSVSAAKIIDDDVLVLDDEPPPRPPDPLSNHIGFADSNNQVVLHPMMTGFDGRVYVPTLQLQMTSPRQFQTVSEQVLAKNLNWSKAREHEPCPLRMERAESVTVNNDFEECLNQQEKSREIIRTENMNIVLNFDDSESDSKMMTSYETELNATAVSIENNEANVCLYLNKGVKMKDGMEKRPLLSVGRVDWEDKIPMDVISFMDATDPNPSERIMQPNISDVRTVIEDDANDVLIVDNVECIDLC